MFDSKFEAVLADNALARRIHYRLRYRVYCLETGFEDPGRFPDGEETDEFDRQAVHFLVRMKESGEWIAVMRLVSPQAGVLPMEGACRIDPDVKQRYFSEGVVEVSRLAMVETFRRRSPDLRTLCEYQCDDGGHPPTLPVLVERRREPEVLLGLLRAMIAHCRQAGTRHLLFLITPGLARVLRRLNIRLEVVGPPCQHRGLRYPYAADVEEVYWSLTSVSPVVATMVQRAQAYQSFSHLALAAAKL
ncbi:MAG: PEP-CTERM/exosortase system-associated acyltransferase [Pseudomonadota bacterium]|nr:PEP-CTERM/exosortase system-associated acyltransferase [Pseudomonadota bacterium]